MNIGRTITRFGQRLKRRSRPVLLAGAAAVAVSVPPFEVAERLDTMLYDALAGIQPKTDTGDVVIVELGDPAWFGVLSDMARRSQSRLLVTTLPQPPAPRDNKHALGPTEIPLGGQLLRRTNWSHGGHLDFTRSLDGRVRGLPGWLDSAKTMPALPLAAIMALGDHDAGFPATARIGFTTPDSFIRLTPAALGARPDQLTGRIVVAGRAEPRLATPVGLLTEAELVAQTIQSSLNGTLVAAPPIANAVPWTIVALALVTMIWRRGGGRRWWLLPAGGALACITVTLVALPVVQVWVPLAASQTMLATATALLRQRRPRQRRRRPARKAVGTGSIQTALDAGDVESAWHQIRELPATRANLDALCDYAEALQAQRYLELAADVYYRAALIDPGHRDVARRLVRVSQTENERDRARSEAAADPMPSALGRFELLEPIGRGSTGTVYLAIDPRINRLVALKVINLRAEYDADSLNEGLDRFRREAESAGRLNHPNIVTIFDIGETDGLAYIAMEYLKGRHLSHFTTTETLLPSALVLELGARIADALDYAHSRNVVHRDIKPGNIMYDSVSGAVTITDFGIARLIDVSRTRTGVVLGTPSFMAPEQLEGKNVNRHTDLFALGVTIYELLTGRLPFLGASMTKLMFVIANEPHPPVTALRPDLPPSIDSVLDQALAKRPEDRYARGTEMAQALRHAASQLA